MVDLFRQEGYEDGRDEINGEATAAILNFFPELLKLARRGISDITTVIRPDGTTYKAI